MIQSLVVMSKVEEDTMPFQPNHIALALPAFGDKLELLYFKEMDDGAGKYSISISMNIINIINKYGKKNGSNY